MSKLHTMLLSAIALISVAAPTMAAQQSPQPLSMTMSVMAIGNPHSAPQAPTTNDARIEERHRAEVADWQNLLGGHQPAPAMGVGGHPR